MKIGDIELDRSGEYVFIYTFCHDVTSDFDLKINGAEGMPDSWRDLVLEYNSDDLSDEERWDIGEVVFGREYIHKWDKRTNWSVFIGKYDDWITHVGDHVRDSSLSPEWIFDLMLRYKTELREYELAVKKEGSVK